MDRTLKSSSSRAGISLVETIVALTIFSIVSTIMFTALRTADRTSGKGILLRTAVMLAADQSELLKEAGLRGTLPESDTLYFVQNGNRTFWVRRTRMERSPDAPCVSCAQHSITVALDEFAEPIVEIMALTGTGGGRDDQ